MRRSLLFFPAVFALVAIDSAAPAAENFACGVDGKPNAKTAKCDCPASKVEKTTGDVSRCVDKPAPAAKPSTSSAAPPASSAKALASTTPKACPLGMAPIAGGSYTMGVSAQKTTVVDFCMDQTEVTVAAWAACAKTSACVAAPTTVEWVGINDEQRTKGSAYCNGARVDRLDHPINCVDWNQATAYCAAVGKRLPSEDEWEWAARAGNKGFTYPWGDDEPQTASVARICWSSGNKRTGTCAVGSFPTGDGWHGVHDLSGNVWEWTSSKVSPTKTDRAYRGGAWFETVSDRVSAAFRGGDAITNRSGGIGFRCVKNP